MSAKHIFTIVAAGAMLLAVCGIHTVEHAEKLGLGSRQYKLVSIDGKE